MPDLKFLPHARIDALAVGQCTMHRAANDKGARWWMLWFRVERDSDGVAIDVAVPMNPNGPYREDGPGGKTWGITEASPGVWQVSPSINVLNLGDLHPGEHPAPSQWHQTPTIIGVPDCEPWTIDPP